MSAYSTGDLYTHLCGTTAPARLCDWYQYRQDELGLTMKFTQHSRKLRLEGGYRTHQNIQRPGLRAE